MSKKSLLTLLLGLLLFAPDLLAQQDTVRFSVNIRRLRQTGQIQAGDTLFAQIFTGAGGRYSQPGDSTRIGVVSANANDTVYTSVDRLLGSATIDSITYKFTYRNLAASRAIVFEGGSDRVVIFRQPAAQRVNVSRFWEDNSSQGAPLRTRRVIFQADMTDLLTAGFGGTDSIGITGPFRDWTGTPRPMRRQGLTTTFIDTISISAEQGTNLVYKFKGFSPTANRFTNGGWENNPLNAATGDDNRSFVVSASQTDTVLAPQRPNFFIAGQRRYGVRLRVNTNGARDFFGRSLDSLRTAGALTGNIGGLRYGIYLAGEGVFGSWPNWDDTTQLRNSDPAADCTLASTQRFIFMTPTATPGVFERVINVTRAPFGPFKFAVFFNGIFDGPRPGNGRLDNEAPFGVDKIVGVAPAGGFQIINVEARFGTGTLSAPERDLAAPVARQYSLEQNYPNPFNPTTTIRFAIPANESVQLEVYNLLGQRVATLLNQRLVAGTYNVQFNAAQFASGVYFYRLRAGNFTQTNKMMLVK